MRSSVFVAGSSLAVAGLIASFTPLGAQETATSAAIAAEDLRTRLAIVADDSMMGRESGRRGNFMATAYIATEVRLMGLEPGGQDGGYFQEIPLRQRTIDTTKTMAIGASDLALWIDYAPLRPVGSLALALGVTFDGVPVLYGGRLGEENLIDPAQVSGSILVLDAPRGEDGNATFAFNAVVGALQRYGEAEALLIVGLEQIPAGTMRFLSQPSMFLDQGDEPSGGAGIMFLRRETAEVIFQGSLDEIEPGIQGSPLEGGYSFVTTETKAPARNVIAILPGADPLLRNQYVLIGAHNDHVGTGTPVDHDSLRVYNTMVRPWGASTRDAQPPTPEQWAAINASIDSIRRIRPVRMDSIYNGADDDGSGTVAVLEIAEAFAAAPERPRRSVIFMWHTAEEKGLYGSRYFSDHPTVPRDSIVAALNMDMVGRGQPRDPEAGPNVIQIIGSRRISTQLGDLIESVNVSEGHNFSFDYSFDATGHPQQRYCRSDHYMYARYGIPISYFSAGYHQDYHQLTDEVQYINYPHMEAFAGLLHDVVWALADMDERPVVDQEVPPIDQGCRQ